MEKRSQDAAAAPSGMIGGDGRLNVAFAVIGIDDACDEPGTVRNPNRNRRPEGRDMRALSHPSADFIILVEDELHTTS